MRQIVRRTALEEGVSEGTAAMIIMTLGVMGVANKVPSTLRPSLSWACLRWYGQLPVDISLQEESIRCWDFLEGKNGSSTAIDDEEDAVIRALICTLWDDPPQDEDLELTIEFFTSLVDRFPGCVKTMGLPSARGWAP